MSMMSHSSSRCSSARATAVAVSSTPSPENESGDTLTIPMMYVRRPQGRVCPRTRSAPRIAASDTRTHDVGEPPFAQRRDDERRAGDDDDVVGVGVAARDRERVDRIADRPAPDAEVFGDAGQTLRPDRGAPFVSVADTVRVE